MIPQAELERLNSNRLKSRKEVRSFQYKLKVDLIQGDSKQIEVETSLCACYFFWSVIIPVAQVMGVSLNRRPNCTSERKQDQRPKTQYRNITATLCGALKYTLSIGYSFVEKAVIKLQNQDLRKNASSGHEIRNIASYAQ